MTQSQSTDDLVKRLFEAQVGGCECLTKTPEIQYHDRLCKFRLCVESLGTIERLQRELKGAKINCKAHAKRAEDAGRELAARDKTIEAMREDAGRYRWLRDQQYNDDVDLRFADYNEDGPTDTWYSLWGAELDAAIDAARGK